MKSIEEAAKEYAKLEYEDLYDEDSLDVDITIKDFTKGVEFAQRWIPVEEELPDENEEFILVKERSGLVEVGLWQPWNNEFSVNPHSCFREDKITHWRPIEYK